MTLGAAVRHARFPCRPRRPRGCFDTVRVVALGQHFAAGEHRDVIGERRDDGQVVLDHQHRPVHGHPRISAAMRSTSSCAMPAVGSSSSIISGSSASVVAISSARLRPYGSSTGWRVLESGESHGVDQLAARAS